MKRKADGESPGASGRAAKFVARLKTLNTQFAIYVREQEANHLGELWIDGVEDYQSHVNQLLAEYLGVSSDAQPPAEAGTPAPADSNAAASTGAAAPAAALFGSTPLFSFNTPAGSAGREGGGDDAPPKKQVRFSNGGEAAAAPFGGAATPGPSAPGQAGTPGSDAAGAATPGAGGFFGFGSSAATPAGATTTVADAGRTPGVSLFKAKAPGASDDDLPAGDAPNGAAATPPPATNLFSFGSGLAAGSGVAAGDSSAAPAEGAAGGAAAPGGNLFSFGSGAAGFAGAAPATGFAMPSTSAAPAGGLINFSAPPAGPSDGGAGAGEEEASGKYESEVKLDSDAFEVQFSCKAKLMSMAEDKTWDDRGVGMLTIRKATQGGSAKSYIMFTTEAGKQLVAHPVAATLNYNRPANAPKRVAMPLLIRVRPPPAATEDGDQAAADAAAAETLKLTNCLFSTGKPENIEQFCKVIDECKEAAKA